MKELNINDSIFSDLTECFKRNVKNGNIKLFRGLKKSLKKDVVYKDLKNNIYGIRITKNPLI